MSASDDARIKAEIDGIMNGVKTIMQKVDALMPKEQPEQERIQDEGEATDPSDNRAEEET